MSEETFGTEVNKRRGATTSIDTSDVDRAIDAFSQVPVIGPIVKNTANILKTKQGTKKFTGEKNY